MSSLIPSTSSDVYKSNLRLKKDLLRKVHETKLFMPKMSDLPILSLLAICFGDENES